MNENLKSNLRQMAKTVDDMVELVYKGLMENDAHYLNSALNKERIVDEIEKKVTDAIAQSGRGVDKSQQKEFIFLAQTAQNIERMGDELRYLMERIEIKIAEKLYFSDVGIEEYKQLFEKMRKSVDMTVGFLNEEKIELLDAIMENGEQIKALVEEYRQEHLKRLTEGICQPRAANMFFDMLDFTGNIARHCTNIARTHKGRR